MKAGKMKTLATLAVCIVLAGLVFAPGAFAKDTYKIGGIFSVTGGASFLGAPEKMSMQMVVDQINAAGGIDGHMLEAVIYDTKGDPTEAVNFANKLINKDRVLAIVGPSTTPTTMAVIPLCVRARLPLISCAAGNGIVNPIQPYVFKTAQSDIQAVATIYAYMKEQGMKKIAILCVDNGFGASGAVQLREQAAKFGLEVVSDESYGGKDTDMTAQLTKARKAAPDALVCWGTNPGPAVVAKNAQQLKLDFPLFMSHGVASPKFIDIAGDACEGIMLPTGAVLIADTLAADYHQKAALDKYISDYKNAYNAGVSGFGGYAYDAMKILEIALKGTNGDKAKIRDNIEAIQGYIGVTGTFNFSPTEHNGLGADSFLMVEIADGTWKVMK
ncbi:amino acid/amide ABC transporter substrate-binding protein, HAAT family [Desulfatibacillum alkenivorans DSM 16219]|jgi:branched-chain amino acid transport system substrate-binding protein|uniref:Amino acid/amide ABC transporter substrate-binding protein, HAAT family n=1 Tax=Desulfatibacillum alkenivorans DSM 16219 TaxID=1121393 RepID=A0A1M6CYT4_9BACT|nr:ABC transporter substrate-binding protein [Desulfatibacillum alkenivorans]SHI65974.1 amino acid/amide ABC transporter substrate-binding protein, HAAT family [Desulfatibacillum alkenivorans DSM 16219]